MYKCINSTERTNTIRSKLEYGIVTSQGSGVVIIQGILMAFIGQVFNIEDAQAVTSGTIVNLSRDQTMNLIVSGLQLQPEVRIYEGGKAVGTNNLASLILGDFMIGALMHH